VSVTVHVFELYKENCSSYQYHSWCRCSPWHAARSE